MVATGAVSGLDCFLLPAQFKVSDRIQTLGLFLCSHYVDGVGLGSQSVRETCCENVVAATHSEPWPGQPLWNTERCWYLVGEKETGNQVFVLKME